MSPSCNERVIFIGVKLIVSESLAGNASLALGSNGTSAGSTPALLGDGLNTDNKANVAVSAQKLNSAH